MKNADPGQPRKPAFPPVPKELMSDDPNWTPPTCLIDTSYPPEAIIRTDIIRAIYVNGIKLLPSDEEPSKTR